jgi:uncharacterized circularly permuted ATP-grasp superfamily protein
LNTLFSTANGSRISGRQGFNSKKHCLHETTSGLKRVDVIYRRVDDEFIDPLVLISILY